MKSTSLPHCLHDSTAPCPSMGTPSLAPRTQLPGTSQCVLGFLESKGQGRTCRAFVQTTCETPACYLPSVLPPAAALAVEVVSPELAWRSCKGTGLRGPSQTLGHSWPRGSPAQRCSDSRGAGPGVTSSALSPPQGPAQGRTSVPDRVSVE